jgi:hypothetical protein
MLPPEYVFVGRSDAEMCAVRAAQPELKLFNYEEALEVDPEVGKWIQLVQSAAIDSHLYVFEDGPELAKVPGPHADEGGEVVEGTCTPIMARRSIKQVSQGARSHPQGHTTKRG